MTDDESGGRTETNGENTAADGGSTDHGRRKLRDLSHTPPDGLETTDVFQRGSRATEEREDAE